MGGADHHRDFPGRRWLINGLRAGHLVGAAGVGAGVLGGWPFPQWQPYAAALLASGLGILLLDWWANGRYLLQVNGASVLAKLALMAWFVLHPEHREAVFWTILVFSVLIAHAPGQLRHRTLLPRR
ncbi:MAG: hypothetical protein HYZ19_00570 [Rhodocyclales bacterium]|nr:hypothetical protein [Rhodocyclales bacterium]